MIDLYEDILILKNCCLIQTNMNFWFLKHEGTFAAIFYEANLPETKNSFRYEFLLDMWSELASSPTYVIYRPRPIVHGVNKTTRKN